MIDLPTTPPPGVANCHAEGVFSFMLNADLRIFVLPDWTTLAANEFGDSVGFHDHHRDIRITPLVGSFQNIAAHRANLGAATHPLQYKPWTWDSALRRGKGRFAPTEGRPLTPEFTVYFLSAGDRGIHLYNFDLHTVKQCTKVCAWSVEEIGPSTGKPTINYSRCDLSTWHQKAEWYKPLTMDVANRVWGLLRATAK